MYSSLTQREYMNWQKFWSVDPWGSWRDNLHTAILAREIRRPQTARGAGIELEQFMVRDRSSKSEEATNTVINALRAMSRPGKRPEEKKRGSGKTSR